MTGLRLFEIETPRDGARRGRPAVVSTMASPAVAVGVPTIAGQLPTSGPWVLEIPAPTINKRDKKTKLMKPAPGWLTMNDRMYWRKKADITADWREATTLVARHNKMPVGVVIRARFDVVLHFSTTVRRDPVNWHPTVKACIDAMTRGTATHPGYGFLPDDSPQFLHCKDCPHLDIGERLPKKAFGPLGLLVLTVTDLSAVVA